MNRFFIYVVILGLAACVIVGMFPRSVIGDSGEWGTCDPIANAAPQEEIESAVASQTEMGIWGSIKSFLLDFWWGLWVEIKTALKQVIRQVFTSIHQTLALMFMLWFAKKAESKIVEAQPAISDAVNQYAANMDVTKKNQIIAYINSILLSNIKLVEAAFAKKAGINPASAEQKLENSKQKMASALTLIFNDIVKDSMQDIIFQGDDAETNVKQMILAIEKTINENNSDIQGFNGNMGTASLSQEKDITLCRVKSLIATSAAIIPSAYKNAIESNLNKMFSPQQ